MYLHHYQLLKYQFIFDRLSTTVRQGRGNLASSAPLYWGQSLSRECYLGMVLFSFVFRPQPGRPGKLESGGSLRESLQLLPISSSSKL